jgi:hypothetical protein
MAVLWALQVCLNDLIERLLIVRKGGLRHGELFASPGTQIDLLAAFAAKWAEYIGS